MRKIHEIEELLEIGDVKLICEAVDCSPRMVALVLTGERNHDYGKGKRIHEVADALVTLRENFITFFKTKGQDYDPSKKYWLHLNRPMPGVDGKTEAA